MGRALKGRSWKTNNLPIRTHQSPTHNNVTIVPKNVNQNPTCWDLWIHQEYCWGVGPADTCRTMLAVQVAIKLFGGKVADKIVITRPVVSTNGTLGSFRNIGKKRLMGPYQ